MLPVAPEAALAAVGLLNGLGIIVDLFQESNYLGLVLGISQDIRQGSICGAMVHIRQHTCHA
jgi:hypothetical protein